MLLMAKILQAETFAKSPDLSTFLRYALLENLPIFVICLRFLCCYNFELCSNLEILQRSKTRNKNQVKCAKQQFKFIFSDLMQGINLHGRIVFP